EHLHGFGSVPEDFQAARDVSAIESQPRSKRAAPRQLPAGEGAARQLGKYLQSAVSVASAAPQLRQLERTLRSAQAGQHGNGAAQLPAQPERSSQRQPEMQRASALLYQTFRGL